MTNLGAVRPWPATMSTFVLWVESLTVASIGLFAYVMGAKTNAQSERLAYALQLLTREQYGWMMVAVGVIGLVASYTRFDRAGFAVMVFANSYWCIGFVYSMVFYDAPVATLPVIFLYGGIAVLLARVAAWRRKAA